MYALIPGIPHGETTAVATRVDAASRSNIQAVSRALRVLEALNRRPFSSVDQLHRETGLPKPTVVRMLRTMINSGHVAKDPRQDGYRVTQRVQSLSCGFVGDPLVVEAARPWAIALTRDLRWPVGVAILDGDAVTIRFSTIADSPLSPFHSTLNMRLSLFAHALGLAHYAFCPEEERRLLFAMAAEREAELLANRGQGWLEERVEQTRRQGYASRDPTTEPRNSATMAVPILQGDRVLATLGLTFFKKAVSRDDIPTFSALLQRTSAAIAAQVTQMQDAGIVRLEFTPS